MLNIQDFDLNLVRLFVTIIDTGTLSEAAKRHGITKSQVSKNLKKLETLLNTQLIRRSTRRLELTQQGEVLYEHGIGMLREIEMAQQEIQRLGAEPMGNVRLSVPTGLGELILQPMLIEFKKKYPQLNLQIMFSNRVTDLIESQIDVAVRVISTPPKDYVAKKISDITWRLCASPYYLRKNKVNTTHVEKLSNLDYLCPSNNKAYETLTLISNEETFKIKMNPKLQSENFRFLLEAARNDLGVTLLPSYIIEQDIIKGTLKTLVPDMNIVALDSALYILTTPKPHLSSAAIKTLTQFLQEQLSFLFMH